MCRRLMKSHRHHDALQFGAHLERIMWRRISVSGHIGDGRDAAGLEDSVKRRQSARLVLQKLNDMDGKKLSKHFSIALSCSTPPSMISTNRLGLAAAIWTVAPSLANGRSRRGAHFSNVGYNTTARIPARSQIQEIDRPRIALFVGSPNIHNQPRQTTEHAMRFFHVTL